MAERMRDRPSPYITPDGHRRLKQELDQLWRVRRPEVTRALSAAAAEGDRSENAEYIYRKKELREIDRRVRYLSKRLDVLKVIRDKPRDTDAVYFGASVMVADEAGERRRFRIVGPDEIDPGNGDISVDSPLARALLKHRVDDSVAVELPEGHRHYRIIEIGY